MKEETRTTAPSGENEEKDAPEASQRIVDFGASVSRNKRGNIYTLTIVGQVEGHQVLPETAKSTKYEHVMPLLAGLEQDEGVDGLLLLLNTVGGDIEAGLGIAELIAGMRKPTVSLVLGGGHSIGVPLAVAPKVSMIVPSASMTIHPVRMNGTVIAAPQTFNYFERIQERIVSFVAKNSNISEKAFLSLMLKTGEMAADVGSVIYGEEAVNLGLIDRIGGLGDALDCLYGQIAQVRREREEDLAAVR
jgi:ATP-dependent protease ClpP protease subunit